MGEMSKTWPTGVEKFNGLGRSENEFAQNRDSQNKNENKPGSSQSAQGLQGQDFGREQDQSVGKQAASVATNIAEQAKEIASKQLTKRAENSAGVIGEVAEALRNLDLDDQAGAQYVAMAADQLERVSDFVRTADPKEMVRKVEDFARKEPLLFLGGAFTLGLLTARFLKSSSHREEGAT